MEPLPSKLLMPETWTHSGFPFPYALNPIYQQVLSILSTSKIYLEDSASFHQHITIIICQYLSNGSFNILCGGHQAHPLLSEESFENINNILIEASHGVHC